MYKKISIIVAVLVVVGGAAWGYCRMNRGYDPARYSAVFLTNDQVYFGHIQSLGEKMLVLSDVYYLKAKTDVIDPKAPNAEATAKLSLIKLGDELHGPENRITINREHVLFYETMKDDSVIRKAIADDEAKNPQLMK